jgi:hypothetical protein
MMMRIIRRIIRNRMYGLTFGFFPNPYQPSSFYFSSYLHRTRASRRGLESGRPDVQGRPNMNGRPDMKGRPDADKSKIVVSRRYLLTISAL